MNAEDRLTQATQWFIRVRDESAGDDVLSGLKEWLEQQPENAAAYRSVCATWSAVGEVASSPELMTGRRDALEHARLASRRRWTGRYRLTAWHGLAAGLAGALLLVALFFQGGFWRGQVYETTVGERRVLTLADGSVVNLDARSRLHVSFSASTRSIALDSGQASFQVAQDRARPFRVSAGGRTVVALGTEFNVEIVRDTLLVTLIEGHVAVVPDAGAAVENLAPGQQLVAAGQAPARVRNNVDLRRTTAWQNGKLFFDDEPLADAAARMNRYADLQIEVDSAVANIGISGVFKAGDTNAFTDAVTTYFPVRIERVSDTRIRLAAR